MAMSRSQTQLPYGYRFDPNDQELVRFFLYPKLTNPHFTTSAPVRDCNLYACQPLQIWNTFQRIHGEDVFFFTNLQRKSSNSNVVRKIAGGPATWHREDKDHQICVQIDKNYSVTALKKSFSYRNTQHHQPGFSWMMYEYSLPSLSQVTVLCQLRRKDDDDTHQSTQKTKKRKRTDFDGVDDEANTISQKARVDEHNQQKHNMGSGRAEETVSAVVVNGVRFNDFQSFYRKIMQEFESYEMAANSITSSTGHVEQTTASTLNPTENLQQKEVVCIDNDGEVAAKEDGDLYPKIRELLNSTGCSDEADVVPDFEAEPVQADGFQATQVGSALIESSTSEVVYNHDLDSEVSDHSSLSSDWIESFPQALLQANPTCDLIQENEIQMIPNLFFMGCFY